MMRRAFILSSLYFISCQQPSSTTETVTEIVSFPELSPDRKYFICSNVDLVAAYNLNGFQLFELSSSKQPVLLQQRELENWGASAMKWDGKTFVALQHYLGRPSAEHSLEKTRYVRLVPR